MIGKRTTSKQNKKISLLHTYIYAKLHIFYNRFMVFNKKYMDIDVNNEDDNIDEQWEKLCKSYYNLSKSNQTNTKIDMHECRKMAYVMCSAGFYGATAIESICKKKKK